VRFSVFIEEQRRQFVFSVYLDLINYAYKGTDFLFHGGYASNSISQKVVFLLITGIDIENSYSGETMETKFKARARDIKLDYKIWLADSEGNGILGDGKWRMLKLISEKGSLKAACDELGYTYRRTWGNIKKIEDFFGFPLLEKHRGGAEGGSMALTEEGKLLVKAFDRFHSDADAVIQKGFNDFLNELSGKD